ncbi:putative 6-phosphofructose-2-kinase [Wickerhamomyces ciferrii]|uniref:6-phosphofructose-2-kinase n=1 Tax=Wickerhamomyces ciferrii (strain ATCC 14091 / BCRC 22168 / CBS 111 / JCM 3599 / NBRC 0793 / NRRL Y-1031 F-60-10) TaxID=1206466 RepID=K0KN96_WICCF|nr:putative 6-phosphofructose-2-kinase [Wickerhamomyces ciferrii]CCH43667.1 putative 6-phosphofructose-2-kinase [Wickerhamomyces ciferrii]
MSDSHLHPPGEPKQSYYYSDNAIASSSEDEATPPKQPSNAPHLKEDVFQQPVKHVPDEVKETSVNPFRTVSDFNKRPLTDTPVGSSSTSPNYSNINSESASSENSPELRPSIDRVLSVPPIKSNKRRATAIDVPGVTKSKTSPTGQAGPTESGSKLVIVMVGLPARGKSYITNKLTRYLNWLQHECRVFNVGNTRRKDGNHYGPCNGPLPDEQEHNHNENSGAEHHEQHDASFFNPENPKYKNIREKWAIDTLDQLLDYVLEGSGSVGIFDATNSTKQRRQKIMKRVQERDKQIKILYLESICSDKEIVQKNIRLKLSGPDYKDMDQDLALKDFTGRLANYEKAYQTIEDEEGLQYIKMIDVGKKVVAYNIQGFLASQTIYYLLNFNLKERQIWITRHGESEDNVNGRIGGDSNLTPRGQKFANALSKFIEHERNVFRKSQNEKYIELESKGEIHNIPTDPNFLVWTSMLQRAIQTAKHFPDDEYYVKEIRMLNELSAGICEGLTYAEIQQKYPEEFNSRVKDKLRYRYPGIGGESYLDVINRMRPIINEVERTTDHVLLITHRVVARVLLGYFMNLNRDHITNLDVPLHCVYLLEPKPYGVEWSLFEYDETKDWFYKVPKDQLHQKKVQEVDVAFKERKYSVVPTLPPNLKPNYSTGSVPNVNNLPGSSSSSSSNPNTIRIGSNNPLEQLNKARGNPNLSKRSAFELEKLTEKLSKLTNNGNNHDGN